MCDKELLPCPFCGGEAELRTIDKELCYVVCTKCHSVSCVDIEKTTVSIWNTRTNTIPMGNGEDYEVTHNDR